MDEPFTIQLVQPDSDSCACVCVNALTRSHKAAQSAPAPAASHLSSNILDSDSIDMQPTDVVDDPVRQAAAFRDTIIQGYAQDPWFADAKNLSQLNDRQGLYHKHSAVAIPDHDGCRARLLHEFYEAPLAGHPGVSRTARLISKDYWWPTLRSDVLAHVQKCGSCQRNRGATQRPFGEAQPPKVPDFQWQEASMDFITHLPRTRSGYTAIVVVIDRLTKTIHLLPTFDTSSAQDTAALFRDRVFALHGMPQRRKFYLSLLA